jgi:hypothetical protein
MGRDRHDSVRQIRCKNNIIMAQCSLQRVTLLYREEAAMSTEVAGGIIQFINKISLHEIPPSYPSIIITSFYSRSGYRVPCLPCEAKGFEKKFSQFRMALFTEKSRNSAVGITIAYGLDGSEVGARVPVGTFFSSTRHTDRLWRPPSLLSNGYRRLFPWG